MDLCRLTIHEAADLLKKREVSSVELTEAVLHQVEAVDGKVNALVTVTADLALDQARRADERIKRGDATPLTGIPGVLKDNLCTRGIRTTCSSRMLADFVPPYNATVVEKLLGQGMVIIGKANLDEFAMGSSNEHSAFFLTRNPWNTDCVAGGSSGGPAVAVATDETLFALGSDTGGSIRLPASFCNVVGLKPTYGRVSRYGLVAFASSLDQIGPLTKDVTDAATVMNVIAGHDERDSTSLPHPLPDYSSSLVPDIKGMRIGVPREFFVAGMQQGVVDQINAAIALLEGLGAVIDRDASLPSIRYGLAAYYIIGPCEASANLARYDGVKYGYSAPDADSMWDAMEKTKERGFGAEVKRRLMLGTYALSAGYYDAYYLKALKVRTLIRQEFEGAFDKYDALVTPTSPTVPFKIGERLDDPVQMYLADVCTLPVNIAGVPAISVPAGFVDGLPVGLQLIGKPLGEETLLRIAFTYEQATGWHRKKPAVASISI